MVHFALLKNDWVPLSLALIGSTLLTIAVTASLMVLLNGNSRDKKFSDGKENSDV